MYKTNTFLKFVTLFVFGALLNINTTIAQDIAGSYSFTSKKDGAESTVKLFVYNEGGELYGRLRLEGDNEFGIGEKINFEFKLDSDLKVTRLEIYNGYCKSEKIWKNNFKNIS